MAGRPVASTPISSPAWGLLLHGSLHAVVNAIAHIHVKPPRLTKERFVAGATAAVAVIGGVVLRIRLGFHNHAPEQLAIRLAFHQQAANQLRCNHLGRAGEEAVGQVLGGRGVLDFTIQAPSQWRE